MALRQKTGPHKKSTFQCKIKMIESLRQKKDFPVQKIQNAIWQKTVLQSTKKPLAKQSTPQYKNKIKCLLAKKSTLQYKKHKMPFGKQNTDHSHTRTYGISPVTIVESVQ